MICVGGESKGYGGCEDNKAENGAGRLLLIRFHCNRIQSRLFASIGENERSHQPFKLFRKPRPRTELPTLLRNSDQKLESLTLR